MRSRILAVLGLLSLAACRDAVSPFEQQTLPDSPELRLARAIQAAGVTPELHLLRQAPDAPPLETYQVSFWARKSRASSVQVNYLPREGERSGRPFLRFDIPRDGLAGDPVDNRLGRRDSVLITLTIDPGTFAVDFQPSGVTFSRRDPASLVMWYGSADPDLNADGVVNHSDDQLRAQIGMWTRNAGPWRKVLSRIEPGEPFVYGTVRHFSQYAVSW